MPEAAQLREIAFVKNPSAQMRSLGAASTSNMRFELASPLCVFKCFAFI
jgi:hypothetical protein